MARPGVMLYFDMLEPIRVLPDADKGKLLVALKSVGKFQVNLVCTTADFYMFVGRWFLCMFNLHFMHGNVLKILNTENTKY